LTNYHVVDLDDPDAEILVTNHSLGELHKAELVKYSSDGNLADFAVLRLTGSGSESYLPIAPNQGERTQRVSAWGYPGLLLESDPMMEALAEGDFSAVPELVYTEGVISVIQNFPGISLISHTAEVSHGNSGGPLINQKGEVLGINTMIRVDEESNRQVNMALGGPNLNEFLASIN
jgi:S1-C subfamily serine protease